MYKYEIPGRWTRYAVGEEPPTDVGGTTLNITGNDLGDTSGTVWYRISGNLNEPFEKIIYEEDNPGIHDLEVYDINGNGRLDVVTAEMNLDFALPGLDGNENPRYFLWERAII